MFTNTQAIAALASEALAYFIGKRRETDNSYYLSLKDDKPEWLHDAVREAHGEMLPDDWKYTAIRDIVSGISEVTEGDLDDAEDEIIDGLIDTSYFELATWLASSVSRFGYADEAIDEIAITKGTHHVRHAPARASLRAQGNLLIPSRVSPGGSRGEREGPQ